MTEIVDAKLRLEPIFRPSLGRVHDAGVVDQAMECVVLGLERRHELTYRRQAVQVERADLDRAALVRQVLGDLFTHGHAATGGHDMRPLPYKLLGGGQARAGVRAGYNVRATAQILFEQFGITSQSCVHKSLLRNGKLITSTFRWTAQGN